MTTDGRSPTHFEVVGGNRHSSANLPKLLDTIKRDAVSSCTRLLEQMFAATDDLFYDLSKRATSNNEENLYFESMRDIRIAKEGMRVASEQNLIAHFDNLLAKNHATQDKRKSDFSSLSIVESDELEIDLALKNMVVRTREFYKETLYELTMRLDHLLLQFPVTDDNNPLDPQQIARAFVSASQRSLNIDIKARLILFKLYERHVLKQLGHIYSDANHLLVEAGILPKVPKRLKNTGDVSSLQDKQMLSGQPSKLESIDNTAHQNSPGIQTRQGENFRLDLNTLSLLMASAKTIQQTHTRATNSSSDLANHQYNPFAGNPGPTMTSPEIATHLTHSQTVFDEQLAGIEPRNIVGEVITQLLTKQNPEIPRSVTQSDEDVINLVAMFFDKVLADKNLPLASQSLICRLQIPILKIALRDQRFLLDPQHPARRLINTITETSISFDESRDLERDPLYKKIVAGIQTINRQFKADYCVFSEVQDDVQAFIDKEKRKSAIVEKRTTQAEAGKSKIRYARSCAQEILFEKMKRVELPDVISNFLTSTWLQVLVINHLKFGKESSAWIETEQVVADLIWLSQPHQDDRSQLRKQRLQPEIMQRIELGLETAIDNAETRRSKIIELENTLASLDSHTEAHNTLEYRKLNDQQKASLGKATPNEKPWDEMTALEKQQARYEKLSDKCYIEAKELPEGVWLKYFDEKTNYVLHCKLSTKIDAETYIFVNRLGLKVLEKSRRQLAYDMQFNKAIVLDTRPVFERIMASVIDHLHPKKHSSA